MPARVSFALVLFLLVSVTAAAEPHALRLHGSNTIGEHLALRLAEAWLRARGSEVVERSPRAFEEVDVIARRGAERFRVEVKAHGSGTAIAGLVDGAADIGMSSRPVNARELALARPLGDLSAPEHEIVLALDGLAVIVHPDNPIRSLDVAQLRGVFSGRVRDWAALGGRGGGIALHARDDRSGTFDTFKALVLGDAGLHASALRYESTDQLAAAVAADPAAIGFVGLAGVQGVRALAVSAGGEAIAPDPFEVAVEDYPLSRRLYFYLPAGAGGAAREFVDFALGETGQAVVEEVGFVSQRIRARAPSRRGNLPRDYLELTQDAQRLSFNVRFGSGAAVLDNKALRDLDRLAGDLRDPSREGRELMLLGFADPSEVLPLIALQLSNDRVDYVAAALARRGVPVRRVRGFGGAAPVAGNEVPQGRERNRRVEIWLR